MFEIILGTYEEFLLGYNFNAETPDKCNQTFALHSHAGSVRAVASSGKLLASGSADDRIIVYDMQNRKELCMLTHHNGTVSCLQFTDNCSHLISGSQDGVLSIIRTGSWQVEKLWENAHKGSAIIDMALHSSGKLLLTLGADCTLRTWNLVKGRQAYAINLNSKCKDPKNLQQIEWSPGGVLFVISGGKHSDIWSIKTGGVVKAIEHEDRVAVCHWVDDTNLVAGYENGKISKFDVDGNINEQYECHKTRVKVLLIYGKFLVSGSSDGQIKIWKLKSMKEISKYESGCRLTCVTATEIKKVKTEDEKEAAEEVETVKPRALKQRAVVVIEEDDTEEPQEKSSKTPKKKRKLSSGGKKTKS